MKNQINEIVGKHGKPEASRQVGMHWPPAPTALLFSLAFLLAPVLLTGCMAATDSLRSLIGPGALADDMNSGVVARPQQPDSVAPVKAPPPPPASGLFGPPGSILSGSPGSLRPPGASVDNTVKVRAWVNGSPLFEEEFIMNYSPDLRYRLSSLTPGDPRIKEIFKEERDRLIDVELMYQDAINKLAKVNDKLLEKLKKEALKEYEKHVSAIRENIKKREPNISAAQMQVRERELRDLKRILIRKAERDFIAGEYMKSRIVPKMLRVIGPKEIRDHYYSHLEEYVRPETVKWQDVFIRADGKKRQTLADARQFAQNLVAQYRNDFNKILEYNDGDSKQRGGEGLGSHPAFTMGKKTIPTDIDPVELEPHLMKLKTGEIAIVDMVSGVHIIRMVKHEAGGQRPFDQSVQIEIRNMLRNEVFLRERRYLIRELRYRADIVVLQFPSDP